MKGPNDYRELVKKLRGETECYPDECEYCSAEGKCRCQRIGEACDAIEELIRDNVTWEVVEESWSDSHEQLWEEVYSPVYKCSGCGYEIVDYGEKNFCPKCGGQAIKP